jgi:hypothetical protein
VTGIEGDLPYYDREGKQITREEYSATWTPENKRVLLTHVPEKGIWVSTVWLGLDHSFGDGPPLIFETMVYDEEGKFGWHQERYPTEEEARDGHWSAVEDVKNDLIRVDNE